MAYPRCDTGREVVEMPVPKLKILNPRVISVALSLLLALSSSQAQIYKWVDAKGQAHYSSSKEDADKVQAAELTIKSDGPSTEESRAALKQWQEKDTQFNQRMAQQRRLEHAPTPVVSAKPQSLSGGRDNGTAQGKCNLARDILSGSVRLRNGNATDDVARKTAENDIRSFCK
jgi:hypothetical protein